MAVKRNIGSGNGNRGKKNGGLHWLYILVFLLAVAGGVYFAYERSSDSNINSKNVNDSKTKKMAVTGNEQAVDSDKLAQDDKATNKKGTIVPDNTPVPPAHIYGAGKGRLAIVIDDFGYNGDVIEKFTSIDKPLTFAVLPYKQFSKDAVRRGLASNHSVILHLPMETVDGNSSEDNAIMVGLSDDEINLRVRKMLESLPGVTGVNNHQGSLATADKRVMRDVLQVLKEKGLFFIDSRTNASSIAEGMAEKLDVRTGANALFLDNNADVAAVKKQLREAMHIAAQKGDIIVIGHARSNTAEAIKAILPELEKNGVVLVRASTLLR